VNDDTRFSSTGWITLATQQLAQYDPPNVGVVGPYCKENTRILTHDMVHRTHLDIFNGDYYPAIFDNWYVDDWISAVYGESRTTTLTNWTVDHLVNKYGTRYKIAHEQKSLLERAVEDGQLYLHMYLKDTYTPVLGTYRLANVEGPMRSVHEQLLLATPAAAASEAARITTPAVNSSSSTNLGTDQFANVEGPTPAAASEAQNTTPAVNSSSSTNLGTYRLANVEGPMLRSVHEQQKNLPATPAATASEAAQNTTPAVNSSSTTNLGWNSVGLFLDDGPFLLFFLLLQSIGELNAGLHLSGALLSVLGMILFFKTFIERFHILKRSMCRLVTFDLLWEFSASWVWQP